MRRLCIFILACVSLSSASFGAPVDGEQARERVASALERIADGGALDGVRLELAQLFDDVIAQTPVRDREAFIESAYGLRAAEILSYADEGQAAPAARTFIDHPRFARTFIFLFSEHDDVAGALDLLARVDRDGSIDLDAYANLVAALCVVHDRRVSFRVNENTPEAGDPVALLRYFIDNESRLLYGVKNVPGELLVYVVDSTASVGEMGWALKQYAGDKRVGERFFDIKYDYDHANAGTDKRVTLEGFTLQNIAAYGGVCADQAYFAATVGKSIGVPAVYTRARSAEVGHAWVGYLEWRGKRALWNFDEGRYRDYQGLRGDVLDPQTGRNVADSTVSLLGLLIGTKAAERDAAAAFTFASVRLGSGLYSPEETGEESKRGRTFRVDQTPRLADLQTRLALLETGLRICPGYQPGWRQVVQLAPGMTFAQKRMWSEAVLKLCGTSSPDFALDVLTPMIRSVGDAREQDALWDDVYRRVSKREDLAATVRLEQARLAAKNGDRERAWRYYNGVIEQHMDDGPFACTALDELGELLDDAGKHELVLPLYERAFAIAPRPSHALMFSRFSNYHRVGKRYAQLLREQARYDEADRIDDLLGG